jgi:two-component system, cell cycle sensor histidine kinase and response regulator CckA
VRSVRRTMEMCRRTMDPRIVLDLTTTNDVPSIEGNAGQIEQVLLNICLNARDALESARTPKPRIAIHIEPARPDEVRIRISDNGPGIPDEIRARVFEPFFTTKEVGRGTGLGLAMAYSIIADHRGRIDCETLPGQGAQFEIVLPVSAVEYLEDTDSGGIVRGGSETVLLIDDDTSVRRALREILSRSGYSVIEAGDGESGAALFEREQLRVDLVVLDRSMPRLSGDGVLERIEALDTGVPVILLSGHPGATGGGGRSAAVLSKPTDRTTLLRTVREVLDRPLS